MLRALLEPLHQARLMESMPARKANGALLRTHVLKADSTRHVDTDLASRDDREEARGDDSTALTGAPRDHLARLTLDIKIWHLVATAGPAAADNDLENALLCQRVPDAKAVFAPVGLQDNVARGHRLRWDTLVPIVDKAALGNTRNDHLIAAPMLLFLYDQGHAKAARVMALA